MDLVLFFFLLIFIIIFNITFIKFILEGEDHEN
jgi:hypothetical protein